MNSIFQQLVFYHFLETIEFLKPFRFSVERDGREVGVMQGFIQKDGGPVKCYLSRRAIINGGPALSDDITEAEVEVLLHKCVTGLRNQAIYIETRNYEDYSAYRDVFEKAGFRYDSHYDFIINVESAEQVDQNIGKSRKRDVKSSLHSGATIINNPTREEIVSFYAILSDLYSHKIGTPLFPLQFFLNLNQAPFSKFLLVEYKGEVIGGTVLLFDDNTVYEWFACGKDGVYKNVFPSTMATYYSIQFASKNGFKLFDMMGAGSPGDGGYGVREFKAKFGGELMEYGRFRYVCSPCLYSIGKAGVSILKKKR